LGLEEAEIQNDRQMSADRERYNGGALERVEWALMGPEK